MKKTLKFFPALILLMSFNYAIKEGKLQYSFKPGDQYEFNQTTKQTITQTIPGSGDMKTDVEMDGVMIFKILSASATSAVIEAQFTKLKVVTASPMANITMDSDGDDTEKQNSIMKTMMNKPFSFTMTRSGVIEKVENADNIYSGLSSLGLDDATLNSTKQAFQQTISEKTLKSMLETVFVAYPDKALKAGDSWKNLSQAAVGFPVQIDNTWTFSNSDGDHVNLDADASITTTDKEKITALPNGMKSKADMTGRQAMKCKVDLKSGWPAEIKVLSEMKGNMTLLAGGMIPEDMQIPMEILNESTYTLTKR